MEFDQGVALIFRVINFALILGLIIYVFRRKFLGQIRSKIQEKEIFWKNLQNNKDALIKQQKDLNDDIDWQNRYAQELLLKIDHWRSVVDKYHEFEKKKEKEIVEKIKHRRIVQQDCAQLNMITNNIAPRILEHVHENLIKTFDDSQKSKIYLVESIHRLIKE